MALEYTFLLEKARKYCAFQERSIFDVKFRLLSWNINEKIIADVILKLKQENFLNEERYAIAFAQGKLRNNKWGRNKISYALRQKQIPELTIQIALETIDDKEYIDILKRILSLKKIDEKNNDKRNMKLIAYARQKGFQPELVWKVIKGDL